MPYLKKKDTGAVTDWLASDSVAYQTLVKMRFQVVTTIPGTGGFGAGSGGSYEVRPGVTPIWEEIAEEDAGFPDPAGGRVAVFTLGSAAKEATENSADEFNPSVAGEITSAAYVPLAEIPGVATNFRQLKIQQQTFAGTATPTRAVNTLAKLEFKSGTSNAGGYTASAFTLESEKEFKAGEPLQVVSEKAGTGQPDPGGVVFVVYTRK